MSSISTSAWCSRGVAVRRPFSSFGKARQPKRVAHSRIVRAEQLSESTNTILALQDSANAVIGQQISPALVGAGIAALGIVSAVIYWSQGKGAGGLSSFSTATESVMKGASPRGPPEGAVLVFGASGKTGRVLVGELLSSGRTVVAALRDESKSSTLKEASAGAEDRLFTRAGIDITDSSTLTPDLLEGVVQIAIAVGPIFGRTSEGEMGYLDNMTSERVDSEGVSNIAEFAKQLPKPLTDSKLMVNMSTEEDLKVWQRLDDVIMGGKSESALDVASADSDASVVWQGELITDGGGFCGTRTSSQDWDLGDYDGVQLRVRGDGQTYKMNLKTAEQEESPESTYQAQFDTEDGVWTTVKLPWHKFVPVKRAQVDRSKDVVAASEVRQFGLVLSRFEYNGFANNRCRPGPFRLEIKDGISGYRAAKPALVLVGTASVERNAIIGNDEAARKADIPIVQLNPGGVLNYKYAGEAAIRAAGVPYSVVRSVGLTSEDLDTDFLLETQQGDNISGKISRQEVAKVVAEALNTPFATGKTFEVRRSEAADGKGSAMTSARLRRALLQLVEDRVRPDVGLWPFPKVVAPPPPPTEERKQEILADDRVKAAQAAQGRGGRVRDEAETKAAGSVTIKEDGRADASSPAEETHRADSRSAKQWIANWQDRSVSPQQTETATARQWIDKWKKSAS